MSITTDENGRCANCGEDEVDGDVCKYCGWPDHYRGWRIDRDFLGGFQATHPDFDGPEDTRSVTSKTHAGVIEEIDTWIEEHS